MEDKVQIREELRRSSERVGLNGDAGFSKTRTRLSFLDEILASVHRTAHSEEASSNGQC